MGYTNVWPPAEYGNFYTPWSAFRGPSTPMPGRKRNTIPGRTVGSPPVQSRSPLRFNQLRLSRPSFDRGNAGSEYDGHYPRGNQWITGGGKGGCSGVDPLEV